MKHKESLLNVLKTLIKWKKPILLTTGIIVVGAILISLTLSNYYKSTVILYPSNPDMASRGAMFGSSDENMSFFGSTEEMNRLILVANSTELINFVIQKHDLYGYYEIDSTALKGPSKMRKAFMKLYEIVKNENDALEISFEDKDPELATEILWSIIGKIDEINNRLTKSNQEKVIEVYQDGLKTKNKAFDSSSDSLNVLRREFGIVNLEAQGDYLAEAVATTEANLIANKAKLASMQKSSGVRRDSLNKVRSIVNSLEKKLEALTSKDSRISIERFNEGREIISLLENRQEALSGEIQFLQDRYFQLMTVYNANVSSMYLVESPSIPIEKSRPFRSIIVISALLLGFILSVIGVLLIENYREIDWKEIMDAK